MRPWQNKKAILAAVLLVAAAAGGWTILNSRRGGEELARAKSPVVKAQVGGPRTVMVQPASAPARAVAPASGVQSRPGTPAAADNGAVAPAFTQEPESDPTDRLAHWVRKPYYYASLGRRDPFGSLVSGDFESDGEVGLVDVGDMKLVGIAWDEIDRFAMVEDSRGFGHALREGDQVRSGKVLRIERDSVTFLQTSAGESTTITIELPIRGGD